MLIFDNNSWIVWGLVAIFLFGMWITPGYRIFGLFTDTRVFSTIPLWLHQAFYYQAVKNNEVEYSNNTLGRYRKFLDDRPWINVISISFLTAFSVVITI